MEYRGVSKHGTLGLTDLGDPLSLSPEKGTQVAVCSSLLYFDVGEEGAGNMTVL